MLFSAPAVAQPVCWQLRGSEIVAQDKDQTRLGFISNQFRIDSVFNSNGTFGSQFRLNSVWNAHGQFGSRFSMYSAMNPNATKPPQIIKNGRVIGHLSTNRNIRGAVNPHVLRETCAESL